MLSLCLILKRGVMPGRYHPGGLVPSLGPTVSFIDCCELISVRGSTLFQLLCPVENDVNTSARFDGFERARLAHHDNPLSIRRDVVIAWQKWCIADER